MLQQNMRWRIGQFVLRKFTLVSRIRELKAATPGVVGKAG
jgi:hypothetical protein